MRVDIKICGTEKDAKLLKKIIKQYMEKTKSIVEKDNCECYIRLIEKAVERAVKDTKFTVEKDTVQKVCDIIDDCVGMAVYQYTDRVRKSYKIPTKYGYEE